MTYRFGRTYDRDELLNNRIENLDLESIQIPEKIQARPRAMSSEVAPAGASEQVPSPGGPGMTAMRIQADATASLLNDSAAASGNATEQPEPSASVSLSNSLNEGNGRNVDDTGLLSRDVSCIARIEESVTSNNSSVLHIGDEDAGVGNVTNLSGMNMIAQAEVAERSATWDCNSRTGSGSLGLTGVEAMNVSASVGDVPLDLQPQAPVIVETHQSRSSEQAENEVKPKGPNDEGYQFLAQWEKDNAYLLRLSAIKMLEKTCYIEMMTPTQFCANQLFDRDLCGQLNGYMASTRVGEADRIMAKEQFGSCPHFLACGVPKHSIVEESSQSKGYGARAYLDKLEKVVEYFEVEKAKISQMPGGVTLKNVHIFRQMLDNVEFVHSSQRKAYWAVMGNREWPLVNPIDGHSQPFLTTQEM